MWQKYVTRRLAVQVAQAWNLGWGGAMRKVYGVSLSDTLVFRDARKTEYYVDQRQHQAYVAGLYRLLQQARFVKMFHADAQATLEKILQRAERKLSGDLAALSNRELLALYQRFVVPQSVQFYMRMWTVFNIAEPLEDVVTQRLSKVLGNNPELTTRYLLTLSVPLQPNDVLNERIDLLRLATRRKTLRPAAWAKQLARHTETYRHIPMFDFDHRPYDQRHFQRELHAIRHANRELVKLRALFRGRQRAFRQTLDTVRPDRTLQHLLYFLKRNAFLRDYRDMLRQKLNLQLRKFYGELGRRLHLPVEQVATLTNDEIIRSLRTGKPFPRSLARQREHAFLLIQRGNQAEIYSGAKALAKARKELRRDAPDGRIQTVQGVIASVGRAKGRVKIVYTNRDLPRVKSGDVLVATMTRQDFVPAMRKAVAIVIDEGGITSHAAIVSRELKIPCVVGTKIATQVLHDGDYVEVDAVRGVVKILKAR